MAQKVNIGYEALVSCHEKLVSEIASDPKQMAGLLFRHHFISEDTKEKVNQLNSTKTGMARMLVDELQAKVKSFPDYYDKFLITLSENSHQYGDLLNILQEEYEIKKTICSKDESIPPESDPQVIPSSTFSFGFEDLPTFDDKGTIPDPLDNPPEESLVGRDLETISASRSKPLSTQTTEGKLLREFQANNFERAQEILQELEHQSVDLSIMRDSDGKTLLHFACRNDWADWSGIIQSLIEKHHCDVSAVDEEGNTPLHEAYRCGNHSTVTYLLPIRTCDPDTVNKHDHTILRMALKKNDKVSVRELLATGRVDPRRGTTRGHTYRELLEMDELLPQPQEYDGSALQMVEQLAECIESNNHVQPPFPSFKHYYLLGTLNKVLKNRQKITIGWLVERIKKNMLPLPESPGELYDLLAETLNAINNNYTLSDQVGRNIVNVEITAGMHDGAVDACTDSEGTKEQPLVLQSRPISDVHTIRDSDSEADRYLEMEVKDDHFCIIEPKQHLIDNVETSREEGCCRSCVSDSIVTRVKGCSRLDCIKYCNCSCSGKNGKICLCCFNSRSESHKFLNNRTCIIISLLIALGLLSILLVSIIELIVNNIFNGSLGFSISTTVTLIQIAQPSQPLIARINTTGHGTGQLNKLSITELANDEVIPIEFYVGDCAVVRLENKTINIKDALLPTSFTTEIYEQYTPVESTLSIRLELQSIHSSSTQCAISFLIFDSFEEYNSFSTNATWSKSFEEFCIQSSAFNTTVTLLGTSYYYFGLYVSDSMLFDKFVFYQITGIIQQYSIDTLAFACSITSAQNNKCDIILSTLGLTPSSDSEVCIVGSVLQRLENKPAIKAIVTADVLYTSLPNTSFVSINTIYSILLIGCVIGQAIIIAYCVYRCYSRKKRLYAPIQEDIKLDDVPNSDDSKLTASTNHSKRKKFTTNYNPKPNPLLFYDSAL